MKAFFFLWYARSQLSSFSVISQKTPAPAAPFSIDIAPFELSLIHSCSGFLCFVPCLNLLLPHPFFFMLAQDSPTLVKQKEVSLGKFADSYTKIISIFSKNPKIHRENNSPWNFGSLIPNLAFNIVFNPLPGIFDEKPCQAIRNSQAP